MHQSRSRERGQISIFFATTVLSLITFIAFVINIGLFVKAKINLQNAVDAAAFAGASVQARKLTNIAYLNWEMRNTYKEWMFKTYILGNLNLKSVVNGPTGALTDLRMEKYDPYGGAEDIQDGYNIPSVCLDFNSTGAVSVCKMAMVPGLPRFKPLGALGIDGTTEAFIDSLAGEKGRDCANRTSQNFMANLVWAYNVVTQSGSALSEDAPQVAINRQGAFPAAFELALRIRNIEAEINKSPYQSGVCLDPSNAPTCGQSISVLLNNDQSPSNERINKAFYSAFRSLGSGDCSEGGGDELKCQFTLTELAPTRPNFPNEFSLSNLLIPPGSSARAKNYIDLKLMPVNYSTFFTMLTPNTFGNASGEAITIAGEDGAESTVECIATKVGMPIPGYPMGFVKNREVLTYYAVKGQTKFIGMFSPFTDALTLTAYAAAKPFGGRIGPMLFKVDGADDTAVTVRFPFLKSSPFISALENKGLVNRFGAPLGGGTYEPGVPLPIDLTGSDQFWLRDRSSPVGGWLSSGSIFFGIPNMVYDYPSGAATGSPAYFAKESMERIVPTRAGDGTVEQAGLYNADMFNALRSLLPGLGPSREVTAENINEAILLSRAPTLYDAFNYLVPTPEEVNRNEKVDSFGTITSDWVDPSFQSVGGRKVYALNLYAPLISDGPDALYRSGADIKEALSRYLEKQELAIQKYKGSLNKAAHEIYKANRRSTGAEIGLAAAEAISKYNSSVLRDTSAADTAIAAQNPECGSMNGFFVWFYLGGTGVGDSNVTRSPDCDPNKTLINQMSQYFDALTPAQRLYYQSPYVMPKDDQTTRSLFSAYRPGAAQDARNGEFTNALNGDKEKMHRNFYSTKFVTLKSIGAAEDSFYSGNFTLFSEGNSASTTETRTPEIKNRLTPPPGVDLSNIAH